MHRVVKHQMFIRLYLVKDTGYVGSDTLFSSIPFFSGLDSVGTYLLIYPSLLYPNDQCLRNLINAPNSAHGCGMRGELKSIAEIPH